MIRVHGVLVSDEEAAELARRLRAHGDASGVGVAERLERGLLAGIAIVGTSRPEAEVVLGVIDEWTPERLREVRDSLRDYLARLAHDQGEPASRLER
jgi:hypothetical protein